VDLGLYAKLVSAVPMHASPLEHVATPCPSNIYHAEFQVRSVDGLFTTLKRRGAAIGNLVGFVQLRHLVEAGY
jgi:hypothetical protein